MIISSIWSNVAWSKTFFNIHTTEESKSRAHFFLGGGKVDAKKPALARKNDLHVNQDHARDEVHGRQRPVLL
jgi:hypothetical protein